MGNSFSAVEEWIMRIYDMFVTLMIWALPTFSSLSSRSLWLVCLDHKSSCQGSSPIQNWQINLSSRRYFFTQSFYWHCLFIVIGGELCKTWCFDWFSFFLVRYFSFTRLQGARKPLKSLSVIVGWPIFQDHQQPASSCVGRNYRLT